MAEACHLPFQRTMPGTFRGVQSHHHNWLPEWQHDVRKMYIGCTDTTFKKRHYGQHTSNLRTNKKDGGTELSKYVWMLREKGKGWLCDGKSSKDVNHTWVEKGCVMSATPRSSRSWDTWCLDVSTRGVSWTINADTQISTSLKKLTMLHTCSSPDTTNVPCEPL